MKTRTKIQAGEQYFEGSFYNSCVDTQQYPNYDDNATLITSTCRQENGAWNYASIYVPWNYRGEISNCDGDLILGGCY